jgi:hypothetical protein
MEPAAGTDLKKIKKAGPTRLLFSILTICLVLSCLSTGEELVLYSGAAHLRSDKGSIPA